jgi:hypothetical protein|tara:strand:- start:955 stop:1380 length:426 start_codon:yes stop_codon:yes gene_type:complete
MAAGDVVREQDAVYEGPFTDSGSGVTKGQVVYFNSGNICTATASTDGPYAVTLETYSASATDCRVLLEGTVYLTASGSITKGTRVSAAAAGKVAVYAKEVVTSSPTQADVENVQDKILRVVGRALDTATDGNTLRVKLGGF